MLAAAKPNIDWQDPAERKAILGDALGFLPTEFSARPCVQGVYGPVETGKHPAQRVALGR